MSIAGLMGGGADDLIVRVDAQTTGFEAAFGRATKETIQLETALKRAQMQQQQLEATMARSGRTTQQVMTAQNRAAMANARLSDLSAKAAERQTMAMEAAGRKTFIAGGAMALGLGLATKAAVNWESQWASVVKVVDGSPEELAKLETQLRDLTKVLPASHEEIAKVAASAGQLGIQRENIAVFTKSMIELGATTTLAADDAATGMARMVNILRLPQSQIENLSSALVEMGQSGASSEQEILDMSLRIAAAGQQAGLSAGDVLGFANAMSSVGIQAEAGGTAFSQTLAGMQQAVVTGSSKLEGFAKIAGTTAADFAADFRADPAKAVQAFVAGLDKVNKSGGDVYGTLADVGISGQRQVRTLLSLAGTTELLGGALEGSNQAFADGTKLQEAANARFDTTAAKMEIAKNNAHDFAIDLGESLLPVLGELAEIGSKVIDVLDAIPGPVKSILAVTALATAAIALFGGGALLAVAKVRQLKTELATMSAEMGNVNRRAVAMRAGAGGLGVAVASLGTLADQSTDTGKALSGLASVAGGALMGFAVGGPWGAAVGAGVGALSLFANTSDDAAEAQAKLDGAAKNLAATLNQQTGALTAKSIEAITNALSDEGALDSADKLGVSLSRLTKAAAGDPQALKALNDQLDALISKTTAAQSAEIDSIRITAEHSSAMGGTAAAIAEVTGKYQPTIDAANGLKDAVGGQNKVIGEAQKEFDQASRAGQGARDTIEDLAAQTDAGAEADKRKIDTTKKLIAALHNLNDATLNERGSMRDYEAAIDAASRSLKDNGTTLNDNTEKGRANAAALDAIASAALSHADAMKENGEPMRRVTNYLKDARRELFETADQFGMTKKEAHAYVNEVLDIPPDAVTKPKFDDQQARADAKNFAGYVGEQLRGIPDEPINVTLKAAAAHTLDALKGITPFTPKAYGDAIQGGIPGRDSVPILAMPDEHMWTTAEVRAAGKGDARRGHSVMRTLRRMALRGELNTYGDLTPFADGGPIVDPNVGNTGVGKAVNDTQSMFDAWMAVINTRLSSVLSNRLTHMPSAGQLGPGGVLTPAQILRGQNFAKGEVGKPYVWGGVGPGGYDCSGFVGATLNAARGVNPYQRIGTTSSMPWGGSAPGVGRYTIGWSTNVGGSGIGHTAGRLGGLNVESYGGHGPAVGSGARGPLDGMFNGLMHYDKGGILKPGLTLAHNGTGRAEFVSRDHDRRPDGFGMSDIVRAVSTTEGFASLRDVAHALIDIKKEARDVAAAETALKVARKASREQTKAVEQTERRLDRARGEEHKDKDEIARLEDKLHRQRQDARDTDRDLTRAERDLGRERDQLAAAQERQRAAQQAIIDQARTIRDNVMSTGAAFGGLGTSVTAAGNNRKLRMAGSNAEKFADLLRKLRHRNLDPAIMQQILDEGPTPGGVALAQSYVDSPMSAIRRANRLQNRLEDASRDIATFGTRDGLRSHGRGRIHAGFVDRVGTQVNLNGPIHTTDVRALAREIHQQGRRARLIGRTP